MGQLYHHLLIPPASNFVPEVEMFARFFRELETLGALPNERRFTAVTHTGKMRRIAQNPNTGEVYLGPEVKVSRFLDLQTAVEGMNGGNFFDLSAEGQGPTAIPPFALYSADNYAARQPGALRREPYSFSIHCQLRPKPEHIHWSAFGCTRGENPDSPGTVAFPWSIQPFQSSGPACARFWIEFVIADWLMPLLTDSPEILDPSLVAAANRVFETQFTQGCRVNDD